MSTKEIKFRDRCGDLVGRQNGMLFIIRTEPGVIAGTPSHWVTVTSEDGSDLFSTMDHQYFHLAEAKEFCQRIAAGELDLADLRAQYDAEDAARIMDASYDRASRVVLFRARLKAKGLTYAELLELEAMRKSLGETANQILLVWEYKEAPSRVEAPLGGRQPKGIPQEHVHYIAGRRS